MAQPGFWDDADGAQKVVQEKKLCFQVVDPIDRLSQVVEDGNVLLELGADDPAGVEADLKAAKATLHQGLGALEFQLMLGGPHDASNAIVTLQPGAGGVDASDFAEMMLRMYVKWAAKHDYEVLEMDYQKAEEAGIKNVTVIIKGPYAYGRMKAEQGVHRLVRKSPFDSGNRRHTSFAAVFTSPEIDDDIEIEINPADLRIDTYRASGAGGQHVNRTDSAVRLTHMPSGIVVQCQNDRSQHKNKDQAMKQLRAKLYEMEMQKKNAAQQALEATKSDIGWGSQIRSYVLDQSRIKDLRTGVETSNTQAVLDGDLDQFIEASLKAGVDAA